MCSLGSSEWEAVKRRSQQGRKNYVLAVNRAAGKRHSLKNATPLESRVWRHPLVRMKTLSTEREPGAQRGHPRCSTHAVDRGKGTQDATSQTLYHTREVPGKCLGRILR